MTYADLIGPDGTENNMGGTAQFLYFTPWIDIATFAAPAALPAQQSLLTTPHTMKTGKKFQTLYVTIDTSDLEIALNGDIDGISFKPTLKCFYPGFSDGIVDFINKAKNDKFLFLVPLPDGKIVQIGSSRFVAYVKPSPKTDKTTGRGRGTEFEIFCFQPDYLIYNAAVPLTPAA
ncbi:hypothetical protein G8759_31280 [Spirosoma aureum]|uniref:Uncharacterized protein n=1 Tax=Spirosoma aureum TaxID=2692134 RepID=A0A6G9AWG1_9BACT|nr:hypothetical protein [Spirosoma aureum]QIP16807.1 hypothetical protein G8759_31280 [Spirosoma aureum]